MGLFSLFNRSNNEKTESKSMSSRELARLSRMVSNKMSQNYDRQDAIEQLSQLANAEGAKALLRRFDFSMEPSITDQDEKEATVSGIAAAGDAALEPIRAYCGRAESLTWPIKVLRQIVPADRMAEELLTLLDQFDTEYMRNPEPKIQLVSMLEEYPHDEVREAVEPFLMDVNESVRFHACGTIFTINSPDSVEPVVDALVEEESLRVKNRMARGLENAGWTVPEELVERCKEALPPGYTVRGGVVVVGES